MWSITAVCYSWNKAGQNKDRAMDDAGLKRDEERSEDQLVCTLHA